MPTAARHARLLRSTPAGGSTVAAPPATIDLWFSESVELSVTRVRIQAPGSASPTIAPVTRIPDGDSKTVRVPVAGLEPARSYTVQWVTASRDGHPIKGEFTFGIAGAR